MNSRDGNPAIRAFMAHVDPSMPFGQVIVRREAASFEVRPAVDAASAPGELDLLIPKELRSRVARDAQGRFRPLQSAPDLPSGWRASAASATELWEILNVLYPGAVGDWYALAHQKQSPVGYRDFVNRQSGMFRNAAKLSDPQATQVARACCAPHHCLKNRLWNLSETAGPRPIDSPRLVCLEPCQILLELARRQFKLDQSPSTTLELPAEEFEVVINALDQLSKTRQGEGRPGDLAQPANPRRIDALRERLLAQMPRQTEKSSA